MMIYYLPPIIKMIYYLTRACHYLWDISANLLSKFG